MPNAYSVTANVSNLQGVVNNSLADFTPEYWYFTK